METGDFDEARADFKQVCLSPFSQILLREASFREVMDI